MAKNRDQQRQTIRNLGKSGSLSKAEVQKRIEKVDRAELADRSKTTPTNLGGGDGKKGKR